MSIIRTIVLNTALNIVGSLLFLDFFAKVFLHVLAKCNVKILYSRRISLPHHKEIRCDLPAEAFIITSALQSGQYFSCRR